MKIHLAILVSLVIFMPSVSLAVDGRGQNIVIMDSGIRSDTFGYSSVNEQYCWSKKDKKTTDSTNAQDGFIHYEIASACSGGVATNLTSSSAAVIPRKVEHNFSSLYDHHYFGATHGSVVYGEAYIVAPRASFTIVNNSYYDATATVEIGGVDRPCGNHGPLGTDGTFAEDES